MLVCVDVDVCCTATPFVKCLLEHLHIEYLEAIKKTIQQVVQQCINIAEFVNGESEPVMTSQNQFFHSRVKDQDGSNTVMVMLKQRLSYDEIEAEVDHCFDIFDSKLCEIIFTYYKSWAASELLNPSFLFALDNAEKYVEQPMRLHMLLKMTRVKLLRRMFNLRSLITERMNKVFRENIEFLFDRFECQDLSATVELKKLLDILKHSHELLSRGLSIDSFSFLLNEMQENISLVSFSNRLASQIWSEMQSDFLPNFILCNITQRFIKSLKSVSVQKPSIHSAKPSFYCGTQDLNVVHQSFARLPVYEHMMWRFHKFRIKSCRL